MRTFLVYVILAILTMTWGLAQIESHGFNFRYIKTLENSKLFEQNTSNYSIKPGKGMKKIQVRFKMKSVSTRKEMFDPNLFSLVSDEFKIRLRPADIKHNYAIGAVYIGFERLYKNNKTDQENENIAVWKVNEDGIDDTFYDFSKKGYTDMDTKLNVASPKTPKLFNYYFRPKVLRACRIDVYFIIPEDFDIDGSDLYYGEVPLTKVEL